MTRTIVGWFLAAIVSVCLVTAQQPNPTFDVTSVKRSSAPSTDPSTYHFPPRRFVAQNMPIRSVITLLYSDVSALADRLDGGPKWIDSDAYDLEGKVLEGNPSQETLRAMARSMLEDRFQLRIRREIQQGPVYELLVASDDRKLGRQLTVSTGEDCTTDPRASLQKKIPLCGLGLPMMSTEVGLSGYHLTMDQIAAQMRVIAGRPVINRTGLDGKFSFNVTVSRQEEAHIVGGAASSPGGWRALVPSAVREQLGLRLVNATGPVDVLVIDSIQRPTEN